MHGVLWQIWWRRVARTGAGCKWEAGGAVGALRLPAPQDIAVGAWNGTRPHAPHTEPALLVARGKPRLATENFAAVAAVGEAKA